MLGFVVSTTLYDRYPEFSEGQLTKIRAHVVSRRSCAVVAKELGLDRRLEQSGELTEGLSSSSNVLAALMEAVLAALFLARGLDQLAGPLIEAFQPRIDEALTAPVDQKTTLQEELAKRGKRVSYVTLAIEGPAHERTFECAAMVDGEQVGTGVGRTKKDAEQEAANEAVERLGLLSD